MSEKRKARIVQLRKLIATIVFVTCFAEVAMSLTWKGLDRVAKEAVADSGLDKVGLDTMMESIVRDTADKPLVVTRTKCLTALFDHARLSVLPDDRFVDCFPEWYILTDMRNARLRKALKAYPSSRTGNAGYSTLDFSHTCPDWWSVLSLGPKGLADRARKRLSTAETEKERVFLGCVVECYEAVSRLCVRWADVAERRGAKACAEDLRWISKNPPKTFAQAIQWSLLYDRCQEAEGEDLRSQGPFDRLFFKYYAEDLAAGRETRNSIKELVGRCFDKYFVQQHPNGKNILIGGYDAKGEPVWNDLTAIVLEVHYERNRVNPKLTFRYGLKTPKNQLEMVAKCVADGRNSFVFMNEEVSRELFLRRGKMEDDLQYMGLIGCYEPAILGREVIASMANVINLGKPIELALNDGRSFDGQDIGVRCSVPKNYAAFEREYIRQLGSVIDRVLARSRTMESDWYDLHPAPLFSGTFPLCIERARDVHDGGLDYEQSGCVCLGLGTAVDSLAAVRYLVDEKKLVTMTELRDILKADWKDHEVLRRRARREAPKWGNNDDRVDVLAKRVFSFAAARVNATPNGHGGTYQSGFWSIGMDIDWGRDMGATPEGRRAGEKLSRNNVATAGCGKDGPTALILSNVKLDLAEACDGHITDIVLPASLARGTNAVRNIVGFLEAFSRLKGQCLHINCFDSRTLRDAQAHPEKYPMLQVRVCGWNVLWNELSKIEQEHFIATTEAQEDAR